MINSFISLCCLYQDANGRVFYVDHANHRTQWVRPTRASQESQGQRTAQLAAEQRRRLAQTLARRNPALEVRGGGGRLTLVISEA